MAELCYWKHSIVLSRTKAFVPDQTFYLLFVDRNDRNSQGVSQLHIDRLQKHSGYFQRLVLSQLMPLFSRFRSIHLILSSTDFLSFDCLIYLFVD